MTVRRVISQLTTPNLKPRNKAAYFIRGIGNRLHLAANAVEFGASHPIDISLTQTERAAFVFLGEFGYEIVAWIPYLLFLKQTTGCYMRTISRPGSSAFYYFSDEHHEVGSGLIGEVWGEPKHYAAVAKSFPHVMHVHPGPDMVNRREIKIGGYRWMNNDIHAVIKEENYTRPDYSFVQPWSPISDRPIVVVNNKYYRQWPDMYREPVNFFSSEELILIRELLLSKGYGVVYNHFVEPTSSTEYPTLQDRGIFDASNLTHDMRDTYATTKDVNERNLLQLGLYNACQLVIGPQGGNVYLPAVCRRPTYVLMRAGIYLDYLELGRLYGVLFSCFYEPHHLLCWLDKHLSTAGSGISLPSPN